jgi:hypothetical protein
MAENKQTQDTLAFLLIRKVLEVIKESGANQTEATCALNAAVALIPDLGLQPKPSLVIYSAP